MVIMKFTLIKNFCLKEGYLRVTFFVFVLLLVSLCYSQSISEYSLFAIVGENNKVIRLRILPNGQIIDPLQQGTTLMDTNRVTYDTNKKYLYVSCLGSGFPSGISSFTIQSDGTLLPLGTTTVIGSAGGVISTAITPNNQLLFTNTESYANESNAFIFTLSTFQIQYNGWSALYSVSVNSSTAFTSILFLKLLSAYLMHQKTIQE